jgi:hypothetical protein
MRKPTGISRLSRALPSFLNCLRRGRLRRLKDKSEQTARVVELLEDRALLAAAVTGTVWADVDGNGIQDAGEPGVEFAVAELFDAGVDGLALTADDVSLGTDVTDASGGYAFPSVAPASYFVQFRTPATVGLTVQDAGADDAIDSDADPATGASNVLAVLDAQTLDFDAGLTGATPAFGWGFHVADEPTINTTVADVVVDANDNVFIAGEIRGQIDFDHGPGTLAADAGTGIDFYVAKYTPTGALILGTRHWKLHFNGNDRYRGRS